jgi:hypothetical protein
MKSTTKVTIQVENYKGEMEAITGFKSLKLNNHGNWIGYVGRERVENFSCAFDAAKWFLATEEGDDISKFMTKHNMY